MTSFIFSHSFDELIARYRVAGTFENLNRKYERSLNSMQKKIDELTKELKKWKGKYQECMDFLENHNLLDLFKEFIRPKTVREKLESGKEKMQGREKKKRDLQAVDNQKQDIAI